jgi:hypothetical protein
MRRRGYTAVGILLSFVVLYKPTAAGQVVKDAYGVRILSPRDGDRLQGVNQTDVTFTFDVFGADTIPRYRDRPIIVTYEGHRSTHHPSTRRVGSACAWGARARGGPRGGCVG